MCRGETQQKSENKNKKWKRENNLCFHLQFHEIIPRILLKKWTELPKYQWLIWLLNGRFTIFTKRNWTSIIIAKRRCKVVLHLSNITLELFEWKHKSKSIYESRMVSVISKSKVATGFCVIFSVVVMKAVFKSKKIHWMSNFVL